MAPKREPLLLAGQPAKPPELDEASRGGDDDFRRKLAELMRYYTSKSGNDTISLKEYMNRMQKGQSHIYYIMGASIAALPTSPALDTLRTKGLEVFTSPTPSKSTPRFRWTLT